MTPSNIFKGLCRSNLSQSNMSGQQSKSTFWKNIAQIKNYFRFASLPFTQRCRRDPNSNGNMKYERNKKTCQQHEKSAALKLTHLADKAKCKLKPSMLQSSRRSRAFFAIFRSSCAWWSSALRVGGPKARVPCVWWSLCDLGAAVWSQARDAELISDQVESEVISNVERNLWRQDSVGIEKVASSFLGRNGF